MASLVARSVFAFPLNGWGITLIISGLILFNAYTYLRASRITEVGNLEIFSQLMVDIVALSALFHFSGGATNPFISMYLLPLAISAVLLPKSWVWLLAIASMAAYSYLMWLYPFQHAHHHEQSFTLHVLGMWLSFVLSAALIAFFVVKMRSALQQKDQLLAQARERAINDEKLVSLGTLAASTAHEMGTPLGTIQLIVADLEENKITQQDIDTLLQQVTRCKQALADMSSAVGANQYDVNGIVNFGDYINELLDSWHKTRPQVTLKKEISGNKQAGLIASRALSKALINLLDNAADASPDFIKIEASWENDKAQLAILDHGEGIDPKILGEIGCKPYTTKPDGIGLGAFLAHEIIQRLGGAIKLTNRPAGGVKTLVTLPLQPIK